MSSDKNSSDIDLLNLMISKFNNIMSLRSSLNLKVAKRVTFLTRFTIISFGAIVISFLLFMFVVATQVGALTVAVQSMNKHFVRMTSDMVVMRETIHQMDEDVQSMPSMLSSLDSMNDSMYQMDGSIYNMTDDMSKISIDMNKMQKTVKTLDYSFVKMEKSMVRMSYDVNNISKPMRAFNDFNPFGQ